ncbi:CGNR zinc finger domain-containing protein [Kribbella sancticallisti]
MGTCAADGCADVYIDVSARAHRRFCSVTCQNRTRVAAFRRRQST